MGRAVTRFDRGRGLGTRWVALPLALAAAGCATPNPPPANAGIAVPERWAESDSAPLTSDVAAYWTQLGDPLLTQLVEQALANNLDLAQSAARLEQARAQLVSARAGYFPQVSASAGASKDVGDFAQKKVGFNAGLDASWEADLFGQISGNVAASRADLAAAGYSLADLQRVIAGQVALTTIQARATALQLAIARDTLKYQDDNLQIARWRVQAGLVSSLDVEQARTQRAQTAATIPALESSLAATSNAISTLVGETPGRVRNLLEQTVPFPTPPALARLNAPADIVRRRPDVRQAEATLASDTARIGVARAQLFPLLQLTGTIGTSDLGPLNLFDAVTGSVTGTLTQLLFDGGRARSQVRSARAQAEASLAGWRKTILTALEEVESAIAARRAADARLTDYLEAADAANNAAILARSEYQAGLTDFQTLLTSEAQLLSARNAVISAEADRAAAFVRLTQALGGGWNGANPAQPTSDDRTAP